MAVVHVLNASVRDIMPLPCHCHWRLTKEGDAWLTKFVASATRLYDVIVDGAMFVCVQVLHRQAFCPQYPAACELPSQSDSSLSMFFPLKGALIWADALVDDVADDITTRLTTASLDNSAAVPGLMAMVVASGVPWSRCLQCEGALSRCKVCAAGRAV
jgi:hypothetical protein